MSLFLSRLAGSCCRIDRADPKQTDHVLLANLINRVYSTGEKGIFVEPFLRVTVDDVADLVNKGQLLVANLSFTDGKIVTYAGCIKVCWGIEEGLGEFGLLAVDESIQGKGLGSLLIQSAERIMEVEGRCCRSQLELLYPSEWKHEHKERLKKWYFNLGYRKGTTKCLPESTKLLGLDRMELACDASFTVYTKTLSTTGLLSKLNDDGGGGDDEDGNIFAPFCGQILKNDRLNHCESEEVEEDEKPKWLRYLPQLLPRNHNAPNKIKGSLIVKSTDIHGSHSSSKNSGGRSKSSRKSGRILRGAPYRSRECPPRKPNVVELNALMQLWDPKKD